MEDQIVVSILCTAYNHEPYIRQCLDGFVMQKTNFKFEAIVHDDASTDNTASVIREYAEKYPNIIIPIYQIENQYRKTNIYSIYLYPRCKGKYIAICEGDDYWADPYKLQKQVDFLEANPEYGLVYGKARMYDQKSKTFLRNTIGVTFGGFEQMLYNNPIPTLTVMYRKDLYFLYQKEELTKGKNWAMGDYPMWLFLAYSVKVKFLDEVVAVYRLMQESATGRNDFDKREKFIFSEYDVRLFFADKYNLDIKDNIDQIYYKSLFSNAVVFGKTDKIKEYFIKIKEPTKDEIKNFNIYKNLFLRNIYLFYKKVRHCCSIMFRKIIIS